MSEERIEKAYETVAAEEGIKVSQLETAIRRYKKERVFQKARRDEKKRRREEDPSFDAYCKRLASIRRMAKKYGWSYDEVVRARDEAYQEIYD